ncbi:MAG: YggS family pyridoxal phosphate-dependent enzyme [Raoultibacter sp.]
MSIETRYTRLRADLDRACLECGRAPEEVTLLAVSKTVGIAEVGQAQAAGARDFGENRPELLAEKASALPQANWHFIGNVQSRRIPEIVSHATLIHSLFEARHIQKVAAAAADLGKVQRILLEVNVSGEASKSGLVPGDVADMLRFCGDLPTVEVCGLMTMAPQGTPAQIQECFGGLANLQQGLIRDVCPGIPRVHLHELSMGMSEDWRYGVALGATIVRIGRAIFDDAFE